MIVDCQAKTNVLYLFTRGVNVCVKYVKLPNMFLYCWLIIYLNTSIEKVQLKRNLRHMILYKTCEDMNLNRLINN